jgi:hypothetical protein
VVPSRRLQREVIILQNNSCQPIGRFYRHLRLAHPGVPAPALLRLAADEQHTEARLTRLHHSMPGLEKSYWLTAVQDHLVQAKWIRHLASTIKARVAVRLFNKHRHDDDDALQVGTDA